MDAEQIAAKRLRTLGYNFRDFSIDDFVAWVEESIRRKIFFFLHILFTVMAWIISFTRLVKIIRRGMSKRLVAAYRL